MASNFYVVRFSGGNQLVARCWLSKGKDQCYFPNHYSSLRYYDAVRNMEAPDVSWTVYDVVGILGKADNYEVAIKKLYRAELLSDRETSRDIDEPAKRRRRIPFIEEEDHLIDSQLLHGRNKKARSSFSSFTPEESTRKDFNTSTSSRSKMDLWKSSTPNGFGNVCNKLAKLELQINEMKQLQVQILEKLEKLTRNNVESGSDLKQNFEFPIGRMEDLLALENAIQEEEYKLYLVKKLRMIGGKGTKNIVVRQLQFLITSELADKFSYFGTKNKKSFSILGLHDVIFEVTNKYNLTTKEEIKEHIQNWLRHARGRLKLPARELTTA